MGAAAAEGWVRPRESKPRHNNSEGRDQCIGDPLRNIGIAQVGVGDIVDEDGDADGDDVRKDDPVRGTERKVTVTESFPHWQ